jgi:hypothetical protein
MKLIGDFPAIGSSASFFPVFAAADANSRVSRPPSFGRLAITADAKGNLAAVQGPIADSQVLDEKQAKPSLGSQAITWDGSTTSK